MSVGRIPVAETARWRSSPIACSTKRVFPLVTVSFVFRGGTTQDPPGKEGLAALTARLLERGTRRRTRARIADEVETMGGSFSAHAERESIRLDGFVLSRSLDPMLDVFADMILEPAFSEEELELAKDEMLAEIALAREDDRDLGDHYMRHAVFGDSAYGRFPGGTDRSIPRIARDDVVGRWREGLVAGNLIAGAAGDIDLDGLAKVLDRHLGRLPGREPMPPPEATPRALDGIEVLLVDKPERTQSQIFLAHPTLSPHDPDFVPFYMANHAFGGMFTGRLMQEVRVKRGWSYAAHSRVEVQRRSSLTAVWTFPGNDDTISCVRLLLDLIRDFGAKGVSGGELDAAKGHLLNTLSFDVETPEQRVQRRIYEILLGLPDDWLQRFAEGAEAVDLARANRAAARAIQPDRMALVIVCTADRFTSQLREIPSVRTVDVVPFDAEEPSSWKRVFERA